MTEISLEVEGRPVAWERVRTNQGRFFTPAATRQYEEAVAWTARASRQTMGTAKCAVWIEFCIKLGPRGDPEKQKRGDLDNYAKAVLDGLQKGGVLENDKQVIELHLSFGVTDVNATRIIVRSTE